MPGGWGGGWGCGGWAELTREPAGPGVPAEALQLGGEVAHAWEGSPYAPPQNPLLSLLALWGLLVVQQEKRDSRRVQGPGLGARLP